MDTNNDINPVAIYIYTQLVVTVIITLISKAYMSTLELIMICSMSI